MFTKWFLSVVICSGMSLLIAKSGLAQEDYPFVSAEEQVTLDRSLPMNTALDILSQYSLKFEGRTIVDTEGSSRPIGVMVNNMYWKRALEYILRSNLMKYNERDRYYEIVPLVESKKQGAGEGADLITTSTREVEINAVFFEADYGTLREAGVDWSLMKDGRVQVNTSFAQQVSSNIFNAQLRNTYRSWDVFALLRVFESLNKGEVIANPQIKVLDGEIGKIKVGTNFFLTTRDFAGNTRFTEYESGTILTVSPTVIGAYDSLFVHLDIQAERSSVNPDPVSITKAITESNTQVLLLNGEETAIAGLFSNQVISSRRGIPLLKDLPPWFFGLRYLFGYNQQQVTKKELIIVLQASVVPTIAQRIAARAANKRIRIDEKRQEFLRRMRQLKTANGGGTTSRNGQSTARRRR